MRIKVEFLEGFSHTENYCWGEFHNGGSNNVDFTAVPTCFDPTDFVLGPNGITTTTFDVAWTDANGAGTDLGQQDEENCRNEGR